MESRNKFYLYDRWFYLVKETSGKLIYSSIPSNILNGITIELDKKTYELSVLCFKDGKMVTKVRTSSLKDSKIKYHYKEKEPQQIVVNDNVYVNIFLEANIDYQNVKSIQKGKLILRKKNIMKKLCYRKPDFPLDCEIGINNLDIESYYLEYFKNICEFISINKNKFISYIESVPKKKEVIDIPQVNSINIPNEIYYYDRNYTLSKQDANTACYINTDDEYCELEVKFDHIYNNITDIFLRYKESKNMRIPNYELRIVPNSLNGITTTFKSNRLSNIKLSEKLLEDALFDSTIVFDEDNKIMSFNTKITAKKEVYNLTISPVFSTMYSDEYGNEYRLIDRYYCNLLGIAKLSPMGYSCIKKNFFLPKNKKSVII